MQPLQTLHAVPRYCTGSAAERYLGLCAREALPALPAVEAALRVEAAPPGAPACLPHLQLQAAGVTDAQGQLLLLALADRGTAVQSLQLARNPLGDGFALKLASMLCPATASPTSWQPHPLPPPSPHRLPALRRLSVSGCEVGARALEALVRALAQCGHVTHAALDDVWLHAGQLRA